MSLFTKYIKQLGISAKNQIEDTVCEFVPKGSDISYLDCGCDDGERTIKRARAIGTSNINGIEKVKDRAKLAKKKSISVSSFDLNEKWSLKSNTMDCVTATEVIEHLVDLDNFFSEARRILKKGGCLIISTENLASCHNIFSLILGNQPYTGPYLSRKFPIGHRPVKDYWTSSVSAKMDPHINVMTAKALISLFKHNGFRVKESKGVGFYPLPGPFSCLLSFVDKYHASYIVVRAIKI